MNIVLNVLSILLWLPAWLLRFVFILLGLAAVPLSLVADGTHNTPAMFRKVWGNVKDVPLWWRSEGVPWFSYLYVPLIVGAAYYGYSAWHPIVFFWLLLSALGAVYCVTDALRFNSLWWMMIRNPTLGLREWLTQPIKEPRPNPDELVYGGEHKYKTRFLRHKLFSEFWFLAAIGDKKFEFRIGFKYADGTPGFTPTIQLRYGN